jgi:two-component system cell cycle response regulator CpdR
MSRILIVDQNQTTSDYISGRLKKAGYSVSVKDNALDAWRAASTGLYSVLMINIVMPGIDAFVMAQRALQENPDLQIIFITGFAAVAMDNFVAMTQAPVTSKPFHLRDIAVRVRYLLGQGGLPQAFDASNAQQDSVVYADFRAPRHATPEPASHASWQD